MLLVVALIAIVGVVTATAMNGGIDGMRLRNAGKELATQLRYTRTQAIASGERQRFVIDPQARTWAGANGRHGTLPDALEVRFRGAREVATAGGKGAIAFYPDGASSGGSIDLQVRSAVWHIEVGWITGEVRSGQPRGRP
ncbi:GspH/FimT family pseudopilin [Stenotrophomonas sp.]|uniref:type II secretion system protein XpsH n=1 Tax=Stenotrophomonas sp. TaxID=69392 RepID=UPI002FC6526A